jgi:hypothetical protein
LSEFYGHVNQHPAFESSNKVPDQVHQRRVTHLPMLCVSFLPHGSISMMEDCIMPLNFGVKCYATLVTGVPRNVRPLWVAGVPKAWSSLNDNV